MEEWTSLKLRDSVASNNRPGDPVLLRRPTGIRQQSWRQHFFNYPAPPRMQSHFLLFTPGYIIFDMKTSADNRSCIIISISKVPIMFSFTRIPGSKLRRASSQYKNCVMAISSLSLLSNALWIHNLGLLTFFI